MTRLVAGWADTGGSFFDHFYAAGSERSACGDRFRTGVEEVAMVGDAAIKCPACVDVIERVRGIGAASCGA